MHSIHASAAPPVQPGGDPGQRLTGTWLTVSRVVVIAVAICIVALDAYAIPTAYRIFHQVCTGPDCTNAQVQLLTPGDVAAFTAQGISVDAWAAYSTGLMIAGTAVYASVGLIILLRRSDDRMALFSAFMLITFGGAAWTGTMQTLPMADARWQLPVLGAAVLGQVSFLVFCYVFPSGRFVPRWTRWVALLWALEWLMRMLPLSALNGAVQLILNGPGFLVIIATAVTAQVYRFRRVSNSIERQQTKWIVYGFTLALSGFLAVLVVYGIANATGAAAPSGLASIVSQTVVYALLMLLPVAIAVAITRSQLFDIDVLINRTLVYGPLTVTLAALYFGVVVGVQALARLLTGTTSQQPVLIVLSTLVIAALVQPLRRRLQRTIDRRFYRRKYDAAKTVERFAATLRQEVELDQLRTHLLATVEETMQPTHTTLWLSPGARKRER